MTHFEKLKFVSRIVNSQNQFASELVGEWSVKRDSVAVLKLDLTNYVNSDKLQRQTGQPSTSNPNVKIWNRADGIRAASCSESLVSSTYGMSEIAAFYANRISKGEFPSSFNALRKKHRRLLESIGGSLSPYLKVREIRTEWAHYSSVFIGEDERGESIFVVKPYRKQNDLVEFTDRAFCKVLELVSYVEETVRLLDKFGEYLLYKYALSYLDLIEEISIPSVNEEGLPILKSTDPVVFESKTLKIGEFLLSHGIDPTNSPYSPDR